MICKIFKRGKGSASGIDYLMSDKDALGRPREPAAELMRGDIAITKKLISANRYAQRYTSGVLSWAENPDSIRPELVNEVIESFQKMVCAGIPGDRINWLWVNHQDKGRLELHFVIPNIDLLTGKRFAPYFDRADRPLFRAWERLTNATYGFSNPADPTLKRLTSIPSFIPPDKSQALLAINGRIEILARSGQIQSRSDVINELKSIGFEISRAGKDYISIKDKNNKKLRLRGGLFEEPLQMPAKVDTSPGNLTDIDALQMEFNTQLEKRARYAKGRFNRPEPEGTPSKNLAAEEPLNEGITTISSGINREYRANANEPLSGLAIATKSIAESIALFVDHARRLIERLKHSYVTPKQETINIHL